MKPNKITEPNETALVSKIVAAVQSWQQQMPVESSLAECEAGAQQLALHLAQLALTEQLALRQAALPVVSSLPCTCGQRQALQRQSAYRAYADRARELCAPVLLLPGVRHGMGAVG